VHLPRFHRSVMTTVAAISTVLAVLPLLACAESSAFLGIHFCVTPRSLLYGEFENSTPPPPQLPNLPKIEAIQTSLFVDVLNAFPAMTGPLPAAIRFRIVRLLLLHWQPPAIAEEVHCCPRTVYSIRENIFMYSSPFKPQFRPKGALRKVFKAAENGLIAYLEEQSWAMQKEMVWYI